MMNIVLATDDNFVQHCGTTIKSITVNNRDVKFYLLTEGLTPKNVDLLKEVASDNYCSLDLCYVPSDIVKYFPMSKFASDHISIATYYRLFITTLLPLGVEKAIYLDCDMIIRGSLEELWNTDLTNAPLAAVYQRQGWSDNNNSWERLRIPREYGYFNAGTLLLNIKYLREIGFQEKAVSFIKENFERIISHDQDVLNALFYKEACVLPCKYNYLPLFTDGSYLYEEFPIKCKYKNEISQSGFAPIIIHFVSKPKPWDYGCTNPYTKDYFKYLRLTPWSDYRVSFNLSSFWNYKVKQRTKSAIKKILKKLRATVVKYDGD